MLLLRHVYSCMTLFATSNHFWELVSWLLPGNDTTEITIEESLCGQLIPD